MRLMVTLQIMGAMHRMLELHQKCRPRGDRVALPGRYLLESLRRSLDAPKGIAHRARFLSPKFPGDALRLGGWRGFHRLIVTERRSDAERRSLHTQAARRRSAHAWVLTTAERAPAVNRAMTVAYAVENGRSSLQKSLAPSTRMAGGHMCDPRGVQWLRGSEERRWRRSPPGRARSGRRRGARGRCRHRRCER